MTTPVFPYLPGLTWPIDRAPIWDTSVQKALSGKQTRFANKTQPTYRYSAVISGLDSSGTFSSLSAYSKQSLEALFNQTQGGAGIFNFFDPYDSFASAQQFGVGDGTTTAFQLYRTTAGGWNDAIFAPFNYQAIQASPFFPNGAAPNNVLFNSIFSGTVAGSPGTVPANWAIAYDSTHGLTLTIVGSGYVNGLPYIDINIAGTDTETVINLALNFSGTFPFVQGTTYLGSMYLQLISGAFPSFTQLAFADGAGYATTSCAVTTNLTRFATTPHVMAATTGNSTFGLWAFGPTVSGTAVNFTVRIAAPMVEAVGPGATAPSTFIATVGGPNYGSPQISVGGSLVASSTYSIANGLLAFTTPPAAGAALDWTGYYYWPCNFDDDTLALSQIMGGLWELRKLGFTTRVF